MRIIVHVPRIPSRSGPGYTGITTRISQPSTRVSTVTGTPTFAYSTKPISTPDERASSTTIRFATEPRIVRLPANVDAIASSSQPRDGSPKDGITVLNSRTAGTFETRFESTAVTTVSTAG